MTISSGSGGEESPSEGSDGFSSKGSSPSRHTGSMEHEPSSKPEDRARKHICQWAFLAEKFLHGNPSGIDNSICTYGGLLAFRSGKIQSIRESPSLPLRIILVNTKVSRDTRRMIGVARERLRVMPQVTESIFEAMDRIAKQCLLTFDEIDDLVGERDDDGSKVEDKHNNAHLAKSFSVLENLIDTNQGLLSALGVSHPRLDEVQTISKSKGFHSKLTGAGGGGFAFALVTPAHTKSQVNGVVKSLRSASLECWETKIATKGVDL